MRRLVFLAALLGACASSSSEPPVDCVALDKAIHDAAMQRGLSSAGICTTTDQAIQRQFAEACSTFKAHCQ